MVFLEALYVVAILAASALSFLFYFLLGMMLVWGLVQLYALLAVGSEYRRGTNEEDFAMFFLLWLVSLWSAVYGFFVATFAAVSSTLSNVFGNLPALLVSFVVVALAIVLKVSGPYFFAGFDSIWNCFLVVVVRDLALAILNTVALCWATLTPLISLIYRSITAPFTAGFFLLTACTAQSLWNVGLQTGLIFVEFSDATTDYFGTLDATQPFNFLDTSTQAGEAIFALADPIFCICPSAETFTAIPFLAATDPELHNATNNFYNAFFYFPFYRYWALSATADEGQPPPMTPFWEFLCQGVDAFGAWLDINLVRLANALADFYNLMTGDDVEIQAVPISRAFGLVILLPAPTPCGFIAIPLGYVDPICAVLSFLNVTIEAVINYPQLLKENYPAYQEYVEFEPVFFWLRKWVDDICLVLDAVVANLGSLGGLANIIDVACCTLAGVVKIALAIVQILIELLIESLYAGLGLQEDWFEYIVSQIFNGENPSIGIQNLLVALQQTGECLDELIGVVCFFEKLIDWLALLGQDTITYLGLLNTRGSIFQGNFSPCCLNSQCLGICLVDAECTDAAFEPATVSSQDQQCMDFGPEPEDHICVYSAESFVNVTGLFVNQILFNTLCFPQVTDGENLVLDCMTTNHGTWDGPGGDDFLYCEYQFTNCPSDCEASFLKIDIAANAQAFKDIFLCVTQALLRDKAPSPCDLNPSEFVCCIADLIDLVICLVVELLRLLVTLFMYAFSRQMSEFFAVEPFSFKEMWNDLQIAVAKTLEVVLTLINIQGTCGPCGLGTDSIGIKVAQVVNAVISIVFELGEIIFCLLDELTTSGQIVTIGDVFQYIVQIFVVFIRWFGDIFVSVGEFLNCFNFVPGGMALCDPVNQPGLTGVGLGSVIIDLGRGFVDAADVIENEVSQLIGCILQLMIQFALGVFSGNLAMFFTQVGLFFEKIFLPLWNALGALIFNLFTDCESPIGGLILVIEQIVNGVVDFIGGLVCYTTCGAAQLLPVSPFFGQFEECLDDCKLNFAPVNIITCAEEQPPAPTPPPTPAVPFVTESDKMILTQIIPNYPDAIWEPTFTYTGQENDPLGPFITSEAGTGALVTRSFSPGVETPRDAEAAYTISYTDPPFSPSDPLANMTLEGFECLNLVNGKIVRSLVDILGQQVHIELDEAQPDLFQAVNLHCAFLWNDPLVPLPPPLSIRLVNTFDPPLPGTNGTDIMYNITRYDSDEDAILDTQIVTLTGPVETYFDNFTDPRLFSDLIVTVFDFPVGTNVLTASGIASDGMEAAFDDGLLEIKFNNVLSYLTTLEPPSPPFFQTNVEYNWSAPEPIFSVELVQSIPDIPAATGFVGVYTIDYQNGPDTQLSAVNLTGKTETTDISTQLLFPMEDPDVNTVHVVLTGSGPGGSTLANIYCYLIDPDQPNVILPIPNVNLGAGTYELDFDDNTEFAVLQNTVALRCAFVWYPMGYIPLTVPTFSFGLVQTLLPNVTSPGSVFVTYQVTQTYTDNSGIVNSVSQSAVLNGAVVVPVALEFNLSLFASDFEWIATNIIAPDTIIGGPAATLPYAFELGFTPVIINGSIFVGSDLQKNLVPNARLVDPFDVIADSPYQTEFLATYSDLARKRGENNFAALPNLDYAFEQMPRLSAAIAPPTYPSRKRDLDYALHCLAVLTKTRHEPQGRDAALELYQSADTIGFCRVLWEESEYGDNQTLVEGLHLDECYLDLRATCGWNLGNEDTPVPVDILSNKLAVFDLVGEAMAGFPAFLSFLKYRAKTAHTLKDYYYSTYMPEHVGPTPHDYEAVLDDQMFAAYLEANAPSFDEYLQENFPQIRYHGLVAAVYSTFDVVRQYLDGSKSLPDLFAAYAKRGPPSEQHDQFDVQKQAFSDTLDQFVSHGKRVYNVHAHKFPSMRHWQAVVAGTSELWLDVSIDFVRDRFDQSVRTMSEEDVSKASANMFALQLFAPDRAARVQDAIVDVTTEKVDESGYRKMKYVVQLLSGHKPPKPYAYLPAPRKPAMVLGLPHTKQHGFLPVPRDVPLERLLNTTPNVICFDLRVPACCDPATETCRGECTQDADCAGIFEFDDDFETDFFCDAGFCRYEMMDLTDRSCCALNLDLEPDAFGVLAQCRQRVSFGSQKFFADNCVSSGSQCLDFANNSLCPGLPSGLLCSFRMDQCPEPCVGDTQEEICINCVLLERTFEIWVDALEITQRYFTEGKYLASVARFQQAWNNLFPPPMEGNGMMKKRTPQFRNLMRRRRSSPRDKYREMRQKRGSVFDWFNGIQKMREEFRWAKEDLSQRGLTQVSLFPGFLSPRQTFPSLPDAPLPVIPDNAFEMAIPDEGVSLTWNTLESMEGLLGFFNYDAEEYLQFFLVVPEFFLNTNVSDPNSFYHYLELALVCRQEETICCTRGFGLDNILTFTALLLTVSVFIGVVCDPRMCGLLCPLASFLIIVIPILAWGWNPSCNANAIPHCVVDDVVTIWEQTFPESIAWPTCLVTTPGYDQHADRPCGVLLEFEVPLCETVGVSDAVDLLLFGLQYVVVELSIPDPLDAYKTPFDETSELVSFVRSIPFFGDKLDKFTFQSVDEIPCGYTFCFYWSFIDTLLWVLYWVLASVIFLPILTLFWAIFAMLPALLTGYVGFFYILTKQIEQTSTNTLPPA